MSNIENLLIQSLGYSSKNSTISSILNNLGYSSSASDISDLLSTFGIKTSSTTAKVKSNVQFAAIMAQLNRSLNSYDSTTSYGSQYISNNAISTYQSSVKPSITAIIQKIKENNNETKSIEDQVSQYLLDNYGGSKTNVILSLSGASSLPLQANALQNHIFQTIVSKLSSQIRTKVYSGQETLTNSDSDASDTDIDTSSISVSSTESDSFDM